MGKPFFEFPRKRQGLLLSFNSQLCLTLYSAACQASMSFTISQSLLKLFFIELVMPSNHVVPFSFHLQSFAASGPFLMN